MNLGSSKCLKSLYQMKQGISKQSVYARSLSDHLHFMLMLPSPLCFSEMRLPGHNAKLGFLCCFDPASSPASLHLSELLWLCLTAHVPAPPSAWSDFSYLPFSLMPFVCWKNPSLPDVHGCFLIEHLLQPPESRFTCQPSLL